MERLKKEKEIELKSITAEKDRLIKEREKIYLNAKQETKRIVADKLSEAEEIIAELKKILKNAQLESREVFRASELKNRLSNSRYLTVEDDNRPIEMKKSTVDELKVGNRFYVKSLNSYAKLLSVHSRKKEAEVLIGDIKTIVKIDDLFNSEKQSAETGKVKVFKNNVNSLPKNEINVLGKTSIEAIEEVKSFIYQANMHGLDEVKIIHGVGGGVLIKTIREYLKKEKFVDSFRRGNYGEGENGVTIVKLK